MTWVHVSVLWQSSLGTSVSPSKNKGDTSAYSIGFLRELS